MKNLLTLLLLFTLSLPSCQSAGAIQASNIEQTLRPVLQRHEAMLNGTLDPTSISADDKISFRRSGYLLLVALETALGNAAPPAPPGLVQNPTQPIPPGQ